MAAPKRTKLERERDLEAVARLDAQGKSQREIAEVLKVSHQQVSYDLRVLIKRYREASLGTLEENKHRKLSEYRNLKRLYFEGWERSCQNKEMSTAEKTRDGQGTHKEKAVKRVEGQAGDPSFLNGIREVIRDECKLLGIVEPGAGNEVNVTVNQTNANLTFAGMPIEEFRKLPVDEKINLLRGG